ncbi:xanthine dehydrogenase family protein molybdopterin-binding subunit [Chloroflexota bacterium]
MTNFSAIGCSLPRTDALEKVIGRAVFCSDRQVGMPGLLYSKILTSPYAHAKILHIDTSKAEQLPGVKAVITGKDAPEVKYGFAIADQYVPARDVVRFAGEIVAAVAAESAELAEEAIKLIEVEYEELPAVFDVEEAFRKDPPVTLHPEFENYGGGIFAGMAPSTLDLEVRPPNVNSHRKIRRGNIEKGFQEADLIVENRFTANKIIHAQLEPHNCIAQIETDGTLIVWTHLQCIYRVRAMLCRSFQMPSSKVRIISSYIGGAFGGYPKVEQVACALAFKTRGRPVRIIFTREEIFRVTNYREPVVVYLKDGVRADGTIIAREMRLIIDGGAYAEWAPIACRQGLYAAVPLYNIPHCKMDAWGVYTNSSSSGPLRGAGVPQPNWAIEAQMDIIANRLGIDPVELRRKNLLKEGDKNIVGEVMYSMKARECLDRAAEWINWGKPSEPKNSHQRKGKGIALGSKCTVPVAACALVKVQGDGTFLLYHSADEIGQGVNTILSQVVAEEFGVPIGDVKVVQGDTAITPYFFGSVASTTTYHLGNAVKLACEDAKRQLLDLAAGRLSVPVNSLVIEQGRIYVKGVHQRTITITEIFSPLIGGKGTRLPEGGEILGRGTYMQIESPIDPETGQSERANAFYSEGAVATEVAVDIETGQVEILRICSVFNMGNPINPKLCEGQMEGGILMGIGSALYEEIIQENGRVCNPNFKDYRVPSIKQMPAGGNVECMIEASPHPEGPYGAKGVGEGALNPVAPAVTNAVFNAIGVMTRELPITAEKVLNSIEEANND